MSTVGIARPAPDVSSPGELRAAIGRLAAAGSRLLVVVDFDGTLAVGSRDPVVARIEPAAQRALRHLARLAADHAGRPERVWVAVLTGRTVRDVAGRVRVGGIEYLGDHGLESATLGRGERASALRSVGRIRTDPRFAAQHATAHALADGVWAELDRPDWLFVERKGPSVAFHVRQADDVPAARAAVVVALAVVERRDGLEGHGLRHYRGRSVLDLRPAAAGGKDEAVERLIADHRPTAVLVMGDELSDVDAFSAVRAAAAGGIPGLSVAVHADAGRAAPAELLAVADLCLASPRRVGPFLAALARAVQADRTLPAD